MYVEKFSFGCKDCIKVALSAYSVFFLPLV